MWSTSKKISLALVIHSTTTTTAEAATTTKHKLSIKFISLIGVIQLLSWRVINARATVLRNTRGDSFVSAITTVCLHVCMYCCLCACCVSHYACVSDTLKIKSYVYVFFIQFLIFKIIERQFCTLLLSIIVRVYVCIYIWTFARLYLLRKYLVVRFLTATYITLLTFEY